MARLLGLFLARKNETPPRYIGLVIGLYICNFGSYRLGLILRPDRPLRIRLVWVIYQKVKNTLLLCLFFLFSPKLCSGVEEEKTLESSNRQTAMSKVLMQPIGQKRLTNVAVVRLKKHGIRFEIACYKNKVLSWRSGVEKDLDEVLQSHTVYTNVSKGVLAKSKDLIKAFGTDDQTKICLEILEKGELQVAGKERESQLSSQFRDIATIVMQKTINPETQRPYTISMIERLMHEIHFAVDPHSSSKKQALEVIRQLQKHFPLKRSPMRLRLTIAEPNLSTLMEKLSAWSSTIVSKDESGTQLSIICELDPGFFRECDAMVRNLQGRLEILAMSVHFEGETHVDDYDDLEDYTPSSLPKERTDSVIQLSEEMHKQTISKEKKIVEQTVSKEKNTVDEVKQQKCNTCNAFVGDAKQYRDHFKSDWHKHNLKRKTRQLPPLTAEECLADADLDKSKADLKDYSF